MLHKAMGIRTVRLAALLLIVAGCAPGTAAPAAPAPTATTTTSTQRASQGLAANFVTGVLREVSGNSLVLQAPQGASVNAVLAPNATILKQSLIAFADLGVGEQITFVGLRDSSGAMLASVVRVVPQGLGDLATGLFAAPVDGAGGQLLPRAGAGAGGFGQGQGGQGQRPGSRTPGELTITGPIELVQSDAVVVTSASVTYTVRLAESGQVVRLAVVSASELQPGMRITGRGEQTDGAWTLSFVLAVQEPRGQGRIP